MGRIPFTAIDTYAKRYGVRGEAFDLLLRMVNALDDVFSEVEGARLENPQ